MGRTLYHTVEDDGNPDLIRANAPFLCKDTSEQLEAWFGEGYYFWDTLIQLPHWWGKSHYIRRNKKYAICSTTLLCPNNEVLDLVGNVEQINDVREYVDILEQTPEYGSATFTAQFIINHMRRHTDFPYKAIRGCGTNSVSSDQNITKYRFPFSNRSQIDLCPAIQICVLDLSVIKRPMQIIYPEEYADNFTI